MLFDEKELSIIIAALESYDEEPQGLLTPEAQHRVTMSALNKLNVLSPLTYFTKQEFTIMVLAVQFVLDCSKHQNFRDRSYLFSLFQKLCELAS